MAGGASLDFEDRAFCQGFEADGPISTRGTLSTKYLVEAGDDYPRALFAAVRAVLVDAARMGIVWNSPDGHSTPPLYADGQAWQEWDPNAPLTQDDAFAMVRDFEASWEGAPQKWDPLSVESGPSERT